MVAFTRQQRAKYIRLHVNERKYRLAQEQVRLLEEKRRSIQKRLERAKDSNQKLYVYKYKVRLVIVKRLSKIYRKYAYSKYDDVILRLRLLVNNDEDFAQNDGESDL